MMGVDGDDSATFGAKMCDIKWKFRRSVLAEGEEEDETASVFACDSKSSNRKTSSG